MNYRRKKGLDSETELYNINNILGILEDAKALGPY